MSDSPDDRLKPALKLSTIATIIAGIGASVLIAIAIRVKLGIAGDEDMSPWIVATGLALLGGIAGVPASLSHVSLVPRWQWVSESTICGFAIFVAVIVFVAAVF